MNGSHRTGRRRARRLVLTGLAALTAVLGAAPARADAAGWQCRGSALSASVAGNTPVEPVVAGGGAACADQQTGLPALPQSVGLPATLLTAATVSAQTGIHPDGGPSAAQRPTAAGVVEDLALRLPPGLGTVTLGARVAAARTTGACVAGQPRLDGASELVGLTLGGRSVSVDQLAAQLADALRPLGAVVDVRVGEQVRDAAGLTQRALHVRVLTLAGTPLVDVVAGEARVGFDGAVCSSASTGGGADGDGGTDGGGGDGGDGTMLPPGVRVCPRGAELDAPSGMCVIRVGGTGAGAAGGAGGGRDIVVGRPYEGPRGGTVVDLATARKRHGSRCLRGRGPAYAVVGTKRGDRVTGTNGRDRILLLAGRDRADGGRGADCVDGGPGRDMLAGGSGRDRVLGGPGHDALNGGPDRDTLAGGRGNDTINAAFGADRVTGGPGRDTVNVATAGPAARVRCGSGRDTVRGNANERRRVHRCENRFLLADGRRG
jgi:hypothetical protein